MSEHNTNKEELTSTEVKIKEAAKRVFTRKGYAATRTRDIAEESGFNLALINYYFRSKEKLFDIVMTEQLQMFVFSVTPLLNDTTTTLREKFHALVAHYIDMLTENPALPFFIMNEINVNPQGLLTKIRMDVQFPYIMVQWQEEVKNNKNLPENSMHIFINLLAMTVFPFIAAPMMRAKLGVEQDIFNNMMQERKALIPQWIEQMLAGNTATDTDEKAIRTGSGNGNHKK